MAAYLLGTLYIGLRANRYVGDMADFLVAGRSLRSALAIATMVGTELGLVTVMYAAQKGFTGGFAAFHIGLIAGIVTLGVGLSGFIVLPLRRMGVMTIPEFYERRFGRGVRVTGGLVLALAGILNMGMYLKAGALFVGGLTGWVDPVQIKLLMTGLVVLVVAYTMLGGMVSVVLTDYVQFVVLSIGMLVACAIAVRTIGWESIVDAVERSHGQAGFDPTLEGAGFGPAYIVWMFFTAGLVSCAVWPTAVLRACSVEEPEMVKPLYAWSSIGFLIRFVVPQFLGVCALAYLWEDEAARALFFAADGTPSSDPELSMSAMPVLLSRLLPAGLIGLIGAGMLAAFMSTHDSYLLCWSSVLVQDVVAPVSGDRLSTRARLLWTRGLIVAIGGFLLVWSLWYPLGQDLWDYMAVTGSIYFTGAFALLVGGLYWRRASRVGAYGALAAGSFAVVGLGPVRDAIDLDALLGTEVTGAHIGLTTSLLALALMVAGSLLFPDGPAPEAAE